MTDSAEALAAGKKAAAIAAVDELVKVSLKRLNNRSKMLVLPW